jgi:hypothetical protein
MQKSSKEFGIIPEDKVLPFTISAHVAIIIKIRVSDRQPLISIKYNVLLIN